MFVHSPFYIFYFMTLFLDAYVTEWVEMPQFSDANKIYRISPVQYDQLYKPNRDNNFFDQRDNNQTSYHPIKVILDDKNTKFTKVNFAYESTTASNLLPEKDTFAKINENYTLINTDIMNENELSNKCNTISPPKNITTFNIPTIEPLLSTTHKQEMPQDKHYNDTLKQDDGILQYLPIDILKNVHHTLQSQPESLEGKMHFLKTFEKTLMTEIESRLATAMTPSRKIRGADHYMHSYDDHDDHSIGFPSIEGTLMAISFLTFAVYLIRLVMLLFQNMNNSMTTTTAATLLLGKRKRSADLDDNSVKILSDMNTFVSEL